MTSEAGHVPRGTAALEAWRQVRRMLDDLTASIESEAETELELLEGIRVLARTTALCSELSVDIDPDSPWFFSMNTEVRMLGGPNPDGEYYLAMIDGTRRYRVSGRRGTSAYVGLQVLAGVGLTPRRMAAYVSDRDLQLDREGRFTLLLATERPPEDELANAIWVSIPPDASAILVREYIADRQVEQLAELSIVMVDPVPPLRLPSDDHLAEQLTGMAWTIAKLTTLHRTIRPELLDQPNKLITAEAAELGAADTTPDNLYMLGTFRLAPEQALVLDLQPPATRYWSVTVENIWHECIDARRRRSSITNAAAIAEADGTVRIVVGAQDPGHPNWIDTGGRHRGFVTLRWLDNPDPPPVSSHLTTVVKLDG